MAATEGVTLRYRRTDGRRPRDYHSIEMVHSRGD
jgi:hypothetical protein